MPKLVRTKPGPEPLAQAQWEADLAEVQAEESSAKSVEEPNDVRSETQNDRTEFDGATDTTEQASVEVDEKLVADLARITGDSAEETREAVVRTTGGQEVGKTAIPLETEERGTKAVLKAPVNEAERRPFDDYPTEPGWTQALLNSVQFDGQILEPAAGAGWMVQTLQENGKDVVYSDLERDGVDFLSDPRFEGRCTFDNVVTNPPYKYLDAFAAKALKLARYKVALLLPDFALVGVNRTKDLWQAHPPAKLILVTSKMKVLGKVSMFPHVWAVWDNDHVGPTVWEWATVPRSERLDTSKAVPNLRSAK